VLRALLLIAALAAAALPAASRAAPRAGCRTAEVRQHTEAVFGHFATRAAAVRYAKGPQGDGFQGIKIENDGCSDVEVEIDGADTQQQRTSFAAEAKKAGFQVTFEQTGEPLQPPAGQVVGVLGKLPSLAAANALMWKLAYVNFRYIDVVPSGAKWLVVMPQVPVKNALSIAKEVAKAGFHIQFRNSSGH
jgi:hypothetical protein